MSEFKGTKEEKAKHYAENWEEITGLDWEDSIPLKVSELDYLAGYNQALEDSKADNMLYLLEIIAYDEIYHVSPAVKEHAKQIIKEVTIL